MKQGESRRISLSRDASAFRGRDGRKRITSVATPLTLSQPLLCPTYSRSGERALEPASRLGAEGVERVQPFSVASVRQRSGRNSSRELAPLSILPTCTVAGW
jgi:hypothetical protein